MRVVAFDLESYRIRAPGMSPPPYGLACPKTVCLSWDDGETSGVVTAAEGLTMFWGWIKDPDVMLVGHNIFYDLGLLCADDERLIPWVFLALEEGRIRCTMVRSMMIANAQGELKFTWNPDTEEFEGSRFDLARCAWVYLQEFLKGKKKKKKGKKAVNGEETDDSFEWQLNFDQLDGVPVSEYPEDAYQYALLDSVIGRRIFFAQEEMVQPEGIPCEVGQTCAAWALHLMSVWGVRTNPEAVAELEKEIQAEYEVAVAAAQEHGLVRRNPERSRDMKAIQRRVIEHYTACGLADRIPMTSGRKNKQGVRVPVPSTDRDCLRMTNHKGHKPDPGLFVVSEVVRLQKLLTTYIRILKTGTQWPITPRYNPLVETGRTSCAKPNLQNQGRGGKVRACFVPREGGEFCFSDFDTLEMRTLAQVCVDLFGSSPLAEAFKQGRDPHLSMTADTLGLSYEEVERRYKDGDAVIDNARQYSKISNYGYGGGMSPETFVEYARGFGIEVTVEHAARLWRAFRDTWELHDYFFRASEATKEGGEAEYQRFVRSGMVRGRVRYTAFANGEFQSLAAVGGKEALWLISKECYVDRESPLYGCRPWLYLHDEVGMEIPTAAIGRVAASRAAERLQELMVAGMSKWCPDIPISASIALGRCWMKGAKAVRVDGQLVPSRPEKYEVEVDGKKQKRTRWVADLAPVVVAQKPGRFAPKEVRP